MFERKKPWACDVCMSFWTCAVLGVALATQHGLEALVAVGPAYPVALWVLYVLGKPQGGPPMPPLEES
jgi:hypothetical protein